MAQTSRPSSDVSQTGAWSSTGGSFYTEIDEAVASDADYIKYDYPGVELNSVIVGLGSLSDPGVHTGHTFYFRAKFDPIGAAVNDPDLTVSLMEGGDVISSTTVTLGSTYVNYSKTLSEPEAANITDYTNLRLMFSVSDGNSPYDYFVTQAYLEIPDVVSSGGFSLTDQQLGTVRIDLRDNPDVKNGVGMTREFQARFKDDFSIPRAQFKYDSPVDAADAAGGQTCTESGYWFPMRRVVWVNGKPFGDVFAPDEYDYQLKGPNSWDFE